MFPLELYNYAEIAAFLVSLFLWKDLRKTSLWALPYYLGFIVCLELVTRYMGRELHMTIGWMFNLSIPLEILFFSYLFQQHLEKKRFREITRYFMILFAVFAIAYNLLFWKPGFHAIFLRISTVSMILLSGMYFIDILQREVPVNVLHQPMFWISVGLIMFNAGELIMSFLMEPLIEDRNRWRRMYKLVNNNLNLILYLAISVGAMVAVWRKKPA
jgi:hypothetical protein